VRACSSSARHVHAAAERSRVVASQPVEMRSGHDGLMTIVLNAWARSRRSEVPKDSELRAGA
jgi:hypothetical protein